MVTGGEWVVQTRDLDLTGYCSKKPLEEYVAHLEN